MCSLARPIQNLELIEPDEPVLYREQFPYTEVPRILFDGHMVMPEPAPKMWITDTTFRDGQQARPPYSVEQIITIFQYLHRLGGKKGLIRQSEFFIYSDRDREAVEGCMALGYEFPEVTSWIRANAEDFKLVKKLGLKETGILTSVSDYHIFLKLKQNRQKTMDQYLDIVAAALAEGIIPRCHFEDVTRADIYGFCLPFAQELLRMAQQAKMPVKIRLCDTMGYGLTYPTAILPRSIPKMLHAFRHEVGYPGEWLEWHGHNDFHKVHINATTAWMYGCASLNASILGYGERTGNPPLEGAVIEYLGLYGNDCGIDTTVITEIADYFRDVIKAEIPSNYPFVGAEFNTTRAGIHADGILKNEEIYNIFDTTALLNRPLQVTVTDKSGVAGIARWYNDYIKQQKLTDVEPISKRHPGVKRIYTWVMEQYDHGRTSGISSDEMIAQAKHHLPFMFESDFERVKEDAIVRGEKLAKRILNKLSLFAGDTEKLDEYLAKIVREEPSIQLLAMIGSDGERISDVHTQHGEKGMYRNLLNKSFTDREWFQEVMKTGESYFSDLFFSQYTEELILTIACPMKAQDGKVQAVIDIDFHFDTLVKLINNLPVDELDQK